MTEELNSGGPDKFKLLYDAMASDEVFSQVVPDNFDAFINEYKDPNKMRTLYRALKDDEVFSQVVPATENEAIIEFGLGKPTATPPSASGLASKQSGGQMPMAQQPRSGVSPSSAQTYFSLEELGAQPQMPREEVIQTQTAKVEVPTPQELEPFKDPNVQIALRLELSKKKAAESRAESESYKGNLFGAMYNTIADGFTKTSEDVLYNVSQVMTTLYPELVEGGDQMTNEQRMAEVDTALKNLGKADPKTGERVGIKGTLDDMIKSKGTTDEFIERTKKEGGIIAEGVLGLGGSLFAMATPSQSGFFIGTFADAHKEIRKEMPDASPVVQFLYSAAQGTAAMLLEKKGLSNLVQNKSVMKNLTGKIVNEIKSMGVKMTPEVLESTAAKLVNGFLAEAETGGTQFLVEESIKQIADALEGEEDAFEFEGWQKFTGNFFRAAASEGVGGFVMKSLGEAASSIKSPADKQKASQDKQQVDEMMNDLSNPNVSPEAKQAISKKVDEKAEAILETYATEQSKIEGLSEEGKREFTFLSDQATSMEAVIADPNVSDATKQAVQSDLEETNKKIEAILASAKETVEQQEFNNLSDTDKATIQASQDIIETYKKILAIPDASKSSKDDAQKNIDEANKKIESILASAKEAPTTQQPTETAQPTAEIETTDNTETILDKAEKQGGPYSKLAKALRNALAGVKTMVLNNFESDASTEADYGNGEIRINNKSKFNKMQLFFHEALHHVTLDKLSEFEKNPNSKKLTPQDFESIANLKRIFKKVTEELNKKQGGFGTKKDGKGWLLNETGDQRGFANVHEFISEAFSNPEMQKMLKEMKGEGKSSNLFQEFLDEIAKMFGITDKTILDDIFYHTESLIDKGAGSKSTTAEAQPKVTVEEIKSLPLTRIEGAGMGSNQAVGTFISTEPENRYAAQFPDKEVQSMEVDIENPFVSEDTNLIDFRNELANRRKSELDETDFTEVEVPDGNFTIDDLSDSGIEKVAGMVTEELKAKGYDSIYFPKTETQEGELVVFDRGKARKKGEAATKTVDQLRADEQAELDTRIENADQYRVDGKVDKTKLTKPEDIAAFDEIYKKYDALITPKLEAEKGLNSEEKQYALESGIDEENAAPTRNIFKKKIGDAIKKLGITSERVKELIKSNQFTEKNVKTDQIAPSQLVVEKDRISETINKDNLPIIGQLGNEFIVLDGHHRVAASILNGQGVINARVIDLSKNAQKQANQLADVESSESPLDAVIKINATDFDGKTIEERRVLFQKISGKERVPYGDDNIDDISLVEMADDFGAKKEGVEFGESLPDLDYTIVNGNRFKEADEILTQLKRRIDIFKQAIKNNPSEVFEFAKSYNNPKLVQAVEELLTPTQDATQTGKIQQSSEGEYSGTVQQQQGQQENRANQEENVAQRKAESGGGNRVAEGGEKKEIAIEDIDDTTVDKTDKTIIAYHATPTGKVSTGKEAGIHIGTKKAAEQVKAGRNQGKGTVEKVKTTIKRPLILSDMPSWSSANLLSQLFNPQTGQYFGLTRNDIRDIRDSDMTEKQKQQSVIDFLKKKGYDAIAYKNDSEDAGSYSYVLFEEPTIESGSTISEGVGQTQAETQQEVTPEQQQRIDTRALLNEISDWNKLGKKAKRTPEGLTEMQRLKKAGKELGLTVDTKAIKSGLRLTATNADGQVMTVDKVNKVMNPKRVVWSDANYAVQETNDANGNRVVEFYDAKTGDQIRSNSKEGTKAKEAYYEGNIQKFLGKDKPIDIESLLAYYGMNEKAFNDAVLEAVAESDNAFEIAANYQLFVNHDAALVDTKYDPTYELAQLVGQVSEEDFRKHFDKNWLNKNSKWIDPNSRGRSIDVRILSWIETENKFGGESDFAATLRGKDSSAILKEISDLVQAYPDGPESVKQAKEGELLPLASQRFREITGKPLNVATAYEFNEMFNRYADNQAFGFASKVAWEDLSPQQKQEIIDEQTRPVEDEFFFEGSDFENQPELFAENEQDQGGAEEAKVKPITVYHGGNVSDINGFDEGSLFFVTQSKKEALDYARGNDGYVTETEIDYSKIGKESVARDILSQMGIGEEYMLHELIDPRFEESYIGDENVSKLFSEIERQGYNGIEFMDNRVNQKGYVNNIFLTSPRNSLNPKTFGNNRIVNENAAYDLLEEGFRPVVNGKIVENITEDELGDLFRTSDTVKMSKPSEEFPTEEQRDEIEEDGFAMPTDKEMAAKSEEIQTDLQKAIQDVKDKFGDLFNQNMGIIYDPKVEAKKLYNFHVALVNLAKTAIRSGINTAADFAKTLGKRLDKFTERAFNDAMNELNGDPMIINSEQDMLNAEYQRVAESYAKQREDAKKLKKPFLKRFIEGVNAGWFDANYVAKKLLSDVGGFEAIKFKNLLGGASSKAKTQFETFKKEIFGGLTSAEKKLLNDIIQARTVISIDTRFDAKGNPRPKHPGDTNKESQAIFLGQIEESQPKLFNKLIDRSNKYFEAQRELLDERLKEGRISVEQYQGMVDNDYSKRVFLEYLLDDTESGSGLTSGGQGSVGRSDIKSLSDGDVNSLFHNAEWLLASNVLATSRSIFHNRANRSLYEIAKADPNNGFIEIQKPNGFNKETGQPTYKDPRSDQRQVQFFENGVRKSMLVTREFGESWNNNNPLLAPQYANAIRVVSGGVMKRLFATGINPLFALSNFPRDIAHSLFFTNAYSPNFPVALAQISTDLARTAKDAWKFNRAKDKNGRYYKYIMQGGGMDFLSTQGLPFEQQALLQSSAKEAMDAVGKVLGYINNSSEIWVRLAIREREAKKLTAKFARDNGRMPNASEKESIESSATDVSRSQMDFSQGGRWAKAVDNLIPYFNASMQGLRVSVRYARENPKVFSYKVAQALAISAALAAYNMRFKDDYDDLEDEEKNRNIIIMLDFYKTVDGKKRRAYLRIPKNQSSQWIFAMGEIMGESMQAKEFRPRKGASTLQTLMPPYDPRNIPLIDALNTYETGYDRFREKYVYDKDYKGEAWAEYYENKTPWLWRDIGKQFGLSPIKLKAAVGKMTADPDNNMIWIAVTEGYDKLIKSVPEDEQKSINDMAIESMEQLLTPAQRKFLAYTNPDSKAKSIRELEASEATKIKLQNDTVKNYVKKYINDELTETEARSEFSEWLNTQPKDSVNTKRLKTRFENSIQFKDVDNVFYRMGQTDYPKVKARLLFYAYLKAKDKDAREVLLFQAKSNPNVPKDKSSEFWKEFERLKALGKE
jgi:hypothetical protein